MEKFVHGEIGEFVPWYDTDGNIINASDGGVIFVDGTYHWYGQALRPIGVASGGKGGQTTTAGVVMYASKDLLHWEYEGVILPCSDNPESECYGPMRFERPKIIYNEKTKQFVLWCHYVKHPGDHGTAPGTADAGVAVCDSVNGTYRWLGISRPVDGKLVRDCSLYQDEDGSAYFIYDRHDPDTLNREGKEERCLYMVKLSEDYLSFTDTYKRLDACEWREAPVIVKKGAYYYMVTSGLSGWKPNRAEAFRSRELLGEWESIGDPCIGDEAHTTYGAQSTNAIKVEGKEDVYIVMFERHNTENFLECSYLWLPMEFHEDDTISFTYQKEWSL